MTERKRRGKSDDKPVWRRRTSHMLRLTDVKRVLVVTVWGSRTCWRVLALDTPVFDGSGEELQSFWADQLEHVFAHHAHVNLGTWASFGEAKKAAERFARSWRAQLRRTGRGIDERERLPV